MANRNLERFQEPILEPIAPVVSDVNVVPEPPIVHPVNPLPEPVIEGEFRELPPNTESPEEEEPEEEEVEVAKAPRTHRRLTEIAEGGLNKAAGAAEGTRYALGEMKSMVDDDISDMVEVTEDDIMGDDGEGIDDLTDVDIDDVMGGSEDLSDLTRVSQEDVVGRPITSRQDRLQRKAVRRRQRPPTSMGGMNI